MACPPTLVKRLLTSDGGGPSASEKRGDVMHLKRATRAVVAAAALFAIVGSVARGESQTSAQARWVTAWGTSQQTAGPSLTNTTVRLNARVTIGGDAVRLRFDNTYGKSAI